MDMAGGISSADMQNIAIGFLDIKAAEVKSVVTANRNQKMLSYELLQIWRNKRPENNREVGIKNINTGRERLIRTRLNQTQLIQPWLIQTQLIRSSTNSKGI